MIKWGCSSLAQYSKIKVIHHFNRLKNENHKIISINTEKAIDKIQHPFTSVILKKNRIEDTFFNLINNIYKKPTVNIILNSQKTKFLPPESGRWQGCLCLPFSFIMALEISANAV